MKNYKFQLSPKQEINLANKGLIYQNGKAVFNKETSQELTKTIQEALNKKHLKKETIFTDNKSFANVLFEGLLFAFGTCVFLTIIAGCIIAFINLLNY